MREVQFDCELCLLSEHNCNFLNRGCLYNKYGINFEFWHDNTHFWYHIWVLWNEATQKKYKKIEHRHKETDAHACACDRFVTKTIIFSLLIKSKAHSYQWFPAGRKMKGLGWSSRIRYQWGLVGVTACGFQAFPYMRIIIGSLSVQKSSLKGLISIAIWLKLDYT